MSTNSQISKLNKPIVQIQVRELVDFALRTGDLESSGDFVGSQRALAGIRGHQSIQKSRPDGYQKEVPVSHDIEGADVTLRLQGRIDGLMITGDNLLVEEIKTIQSRWDGSANPLHWAQAKIYAAILAGASQFSRVKLQLTYLELESGRATELFEESEPAALAAFLDQAAAVYLQWVQERQRFSLLRDSSIRALNFPFTYRPGQRELAVAAFKAIAHCRRLFAEAPTGIGKTVSVIYPALKALAEGKLQRFFYLTARTSGRTVAEKAFTDLRQTGLRARTLTLTAKEKICVQPDGRPCDPQLCPLARGYYDRRKPAMREALDREIITRPLLEDISRRHQVCPFELALDLSSWVDAIICDYNYVFDPRVYLRRHFDDDSQPYAFLVDEAHNLVDRARQMFSADLSIREIRETRRAIQHAVPRCARAMTKLISALRALHGSVISEPADPSEPDLELNLFPESGAADPVTRPLQTRSAASPSQALVLHDLPASLPEQLDLVLKETEAWLARNEPAEFRDILLEFYFRLLAFRRTAQLFDQHYRLLLYPGGALNVRLFCLNPSHLLHQAFERGQSAVLFSATLTPLEYYRDLLGGGPHDPLLRLLSPFPPENLKVLVQDRIRTEFKARQTTLPEVVETIATVVAAHPGNYLAFLPSYDYLKRVQETFQKLHPATRLLVQEPDMPDADRDRFLAAFSAEHNQTLLGFAVMGGLFAEGIDLIGDCLIGAIVVGVGLPQLCLERDLIRDYFDAQLGAGFEYAYTFPGMNRVLQAIGRVIRSETDKGVALLIDTRFRQQRYRQLFPPWWQPAFTPSTNTLHRALCEFWTNAT